MAGGEKESGRGIVVGEVVEREGAGARRESFVENSFRPLKFESRERLLLKKLSS